MWRVIIQSFICSWGKNTPGWQIRHLQETILTQSITGRAIQSCLEEMGGESEETSTQFNCFSITRLTMVHCLQSIFTEAIKFQIKMINFTFITNKQVRGNDGKKNLPQTLWKRNLERKQIEKVAHPHVGDASLIINVHIYNFCQKSAIM